MSRLSCAVLLVAFLSQALLGEEPNAAISDTMAEHVEQGRISGSVTLVAREGRIVDLSAVGEADVETGREMSTDTMFAIASMTKPITATALMILVDEGKVDVNAPVANYLPEFEGVEVKGGGPPKEFLVRHLLTHTNGVTSDQRNRGSLEKTVAALAEQPLAFEPGSKWQYGPGLTVTGRLIEVVAEQPYEKFLSERIFQPLGMKDTTFYPSDPQWKRVAKLYQPGEKRGTLEPASHWLLEQSRERTPNPSGGLFSTARDLFRFYQMVLNGGELDGKRILSKDSTSTMLLIHTRDLETGFTPGNGWGLGWCIVREPQGVSAMLSPGTFGHGGAFGTQGWVDPEKKMVFVLLIQRTDFGNSDGSLIRKSFQRVAVDALDSPR